MTSPEPTEPLITVRELSVWARETIADTDEFALVVLAASSLIVRETAKQPFWDRATAPDRAKLITAQLAKRTYLNPDAVVSEGGIGPIGGDRYIEDFARTLELTEIETQQLVALQPTSEDGLAKPTRGLWSQPTTRGPVEMEVFLPTTPPFSDWAIPVATSGESWMYGS